MGHAAHQSSDGLVGVSDGVVSVFGSVVVCVVCLWLSDVLVVLGICRVVVELESRASSIWCQRTVKCIIFLHFSPQRQMVHVNLPT